MNTLSIKNISKTYPNQVKALHSISLEIGNGMFGLLGPNGSGKSTLMKTIAGLQQPDSGSICFNGIMVHDNNHHIKKQLGFLPQDFGVYPKVSAVDLLDHIAVLKGILDKKVRKEQVLALLQKTNLLEHRNREVFRFSGGMRQRFGVAQALLGDPAIIILDEPTAGLDPDERNRLNNLLSEIGEERIIILSTHLVEDVKNLCSHMAVIDRGNLIAQGKPSDFIKKYEHKLWQKIISKNELADYEKKYALLSKQFISGKLSICIFSDTHPQHDFHPISPSLEDAYFSILKSHEQ